MLITHLTIKKQKTKQYYKQFKSFNAPHQQQHYSIAATAAPLSDKNHDSDDRKSSRDQLNNNIEISHKRNKN